MPAAACRLQYWGDVGSVQQQRAASKVRRASAQVCASSPLTLPGLLRQRKSLEKVQRASAQIADFGEKVADSPAKRKDAKAITLAGVRTVNDLAKRLAPSDVCASLYMEHLLRALQVADDHFASGARNLSPMLLWRSATLRLWSCRSDGRLRNGAVCRCAGACRA